jgi:hypothetical protein
LHSLVLGHLGFHPDALIPIGREQMIDHVEATFPTGPIDRGHVDEAHELAAFVVTQELDDTDDL